MAMSVYTSLISLGQSVKLNGVYRSYPIAPSVDLAGGLAVGDSLTNWSLGG